MKKKFKAVVDDSGLGVHWQVWDLVPRIPSMDYLYAEFFWKHCRRYAVAHAKMLNALKEKEQP